MDQISRILDTNKIPEEDTEQEMSLRPARLDEFIGQKKITENLKVFIESAKLRKKIFRPYTVIRAARTW